LGNRICIGEDFAGIPDTDDHPEGDSWSKVRDYGRYFLGSVILRDKGCLRCGVNRQQQITGLTFFAISLCSFRKRSPMRCTLSRSLAAMIWDPKSRLEVQA
jgi:hypothetical protein